MFIIYLLFSDCGLPAVPGNGGIALDSGVIIYGATATRKCSPGYVPVGLATVHCKIDGAWAVRPFICFLEGISEFILTYAQIILRLFIESLILVLKSMYPLNKTAYGSVVSY